MDAWKKWVANLGTALINPDTPLGKTKVITKSGVSDDPSPHPIMGFSIEEADNMKAALDWRGRIGRYPPKPPSLAE